MQSLAYDAWDLRRNASNWLPLANPFGGTEPTERGYTGHEHLDTVKYIHMNGRVQDPTLGIFMSPDPVVQSPFESQGFNRYAYVRNNPATFTDPSGFCTDGLPCPHHSGVNDESDRNWRPSIYVPADQVQAFFWFNFGIDLRAYYPQDEWDPRLPNIPENPSPPGFLEPRP